MFCNKCGHKNPTGSNFCSSCGAPLDVGRDDRTITFPGVDPLQDAPGTDDDVVIERTANGYVARDMGSLNGTYLNQQRIEEGRLSQGDELQVGRFRLVFLESLAEEAVE